MTADHKVVTSPNFNAVTKIGWETSSATTRARRERLSCVLCLSSGRKNSQQIVFPSIFNVETVFPPISRPDKHAELLKIYFKPLVKKIKFYTLVAKSDLRFNVHLKWEKNNP